VVHGLLLASAVAAPVQQRSQVIPRSEHPRASSPGCTFFLRKLKTIALKTQRLPTPLRLFHCQKKTNKESNQSAVRYGKIFIFSSHYYRSKAKQ